MKNLTNDNTALRLPKDVARMSHKKVLIAKFLFVHCSYRIARLPRRHQLRGPFGQMLMEEMAKSDRSKQVIRSLTWESLITNFFRPQMLPTLRAQIV